jgi:hypothetical protein
MQKRLRGSVKAAVNRFRCHMPRVKQSAKVRTNSPEEPLPRKGWDREGSGANRKAEHNASIHERTI